MQRRANASRVSLPGVERHEVVRGDVLVTPGAFLPSFRLDVLLDGAAELPARVQLHHGTAETVARVVRAGERFAQLRLSRPVVAARGDRFVLRTETTVGGGVVLDPAPARHADLARFEAAERGELVVHAPVLVDGEWRWSDEWLDELRAELDRGIDAADPLDPGIPLPADEWTKAVLPHLGLELRGAKLYRPGAAAGLGEREAEAVELESQLGLEPIRVEDAALARFLEEAGRLVRVGDGFAIAPAAYEQARACAPRRHHARRDARCARRRSQDRAALSRDGSTPTASHDASATRACCGGASCPRRRKRLKTPEQRHRPPAQLLHRNRKAQARQAAEQRLERDLGLEPRERRAEAEVAAATESEVPGVALGREIELVGRGEPRRVVIGGAEDDDRPTRRDGSSGRRARHPPPPSG